MAQSVTWHLDPDGGAHILIVWQDGRASSLYIEPHWHGWELLRHHREQPPD